MHNHIQSNNDLLLKSRMVLHQNISSPSINQFYGKCHMAKGIRGGERGVKAEYMET